MNDRLEAVWSYCSSLCWSAFDVCPTELPRRETPALDITIPVIGMNASTRNTVNATATRRSLTLVPRAASGNSQTTYHGTSQARLAISAKVDQPAPVSQS